MPPPSLSSWSPSASIGDASCPPPTAPAGDGRVLAALVSALAATALVYARVIDAEFVLDDRHALVPNALLKDLPRFLSEGFFPGFVGGGRPVTDLTFALNYAFGRLEPRNFHVTNIAIHLAVVALVFVFTRRVLRLAGAARADWVAVAVAGLFALHPLQTQSVSYVTQRSEMLASGLYILSVLFLLAADARGPRWRRVSAWMGALLAFAAGLGAKAIVLTVPAAFLLVVSVRAPADSPRRRAAARRLVSLAPFVAVGAAFSAGVLRSIEGSPTAGFGVPGVIASTYLLGQFRAVLVYLRLLAWPAGQNVDWDVSAWDQSRGLAAVAGVVVLLLCAASLRLIVANRAVPGPAGAAARVAGLGVAWFFVLLSVTSSIVPLADVVVEHRVYLALWGPAVAVAVGAERLAARLGRGGTRAAVATAVLVCASLGYATHRRNEVWETGLALWSDTAAKSPGKSRVHMSLAFALLEAGQADAAIARCRMGLAVADRVADKLELHRNLAAALIRTGRYREAVEACRDGLALDARDPDLLLNLGIAFQRLGDLDASARYIRSSLEGDPDEPLAWNALGVVTLARGDVTGALPMLERAVRIDPDCGDARLSLGRALLAAGRSADACSAWREALSARMSTAARGQVQASLAKHCRR